jgi:O-antigen/teichoic acid export membrane protein
LFHLNTVILPVQLFLWRAGTKTFSNVHNAPNGLTFPGMMQTQVSENRYYKKKFALKSLWLFAGRLLPVIVLLLVTILYSRNLDYDTYGRYQSIWMYANLINIIGSFGVASVLLSVPLPAFVSFLKKHRNNVTAFYLLLFTAIVSFFYFFEQRLAPATKGLLILLFAARNAASIGEVLLIKKHKEVLLFAVNACYALLFFACHYYFMVVPFQLHLLLVALIALTLVKALVLLLWPAAHQAESARVNKKSLISNWFFFGLNDLFGVTAKWIDKLFLVYLLTPAEFAVFFNGSIEIPLFALLVSVVGHVLLVEIAPRLHRNAEVVALFRSSFFLMASVVFPLFFFLFCYSHELLSLLFNNKYNNAVAVFKISVLIIPLRITNYTALLQCFGKGKSIIKGSVLDLAVSLLLMFLFFPHFGTTGIALAVVIGTYLQSLYYLWHSAKAVGTALPNLVPFGHLALRFLINGIPFVVIEPLLHAYAGPTRLLMAFFVAALLVLLNFYFYVTVQKPPFQRLLFRNV